MVKRKRPQEAWERLWYDVVHSKGSVDKDHIDRRIENAAKNIKQIADETSEPVRWLWSGGKDSQALHAIILASKESVTPFMFTPADELQFTEFNTWVSDNEPDGLEKIPNNQDLGWLAKDKARLLFDYHAAKSRMVIPTKCRTGGFVGITGRRYCDGNKPPSSDNTRYVRDVIMDWEDEEVLAAIYYRRMPLPPCYFWFPMGWHDGPMPWFQRSIRNSDGTPADKERGWLETYRIEPAIVEKAAKYFHEAQQVLEANA